MTAGLPAVAALLGALTLGGEAWAQAGPDTLRMTECPFVDGDVPASHLAKCYRLTRANAPMDVTFDIAVITRIKPQPKAGAVIYIPGGPGDAPVAAVPVPETMLAAFPDHAVVMFNPRGTPGTDPVPACDFGPSLWDEEFSGEPALEQVRECRDLIEETLDPSAFDARRIADDIEAMVAALKLRKAGVYGVSYGTEPALYLLDNAPDWLDFAILDSVSLPGVAGTATERMARDRFLARIDGDCFAEQDCGALVTGSYDDLSGWAEQFDAAPLSFTLGPDGAVWQLDGPEMLDYIASLSAYPMGLEYARDLIAALESNRLGAIGWIREDIAQSIEFAADSLVLSMEAYGDSVTEADEAALAEETAYRSDIEEGRALYAIYRAWNRTGRIETPFTQRPLPDPMREVPILAMSGGLDAVTPLEWAAELSGRYPALVHYIYPHLGHAVSFADPAEANTQPLRTELACAQQTLRRFIETSKTKGSDCERFRRRVSQ